MHSICRSLKLQTLEQSCVVTLSLLSWTVLYSLPLRRKVSKRLGTVGVTFLLPSTLFVFYLSQSLVSVNTFVLCYCMKMFFPG